MRNSINSININFSYRRTKTFRDIQSLTYIYVVWELPPRLSSKEPTCNAGDAGNMGLIPGSGRSPGGGNSNPLKYSCHENPTYRGAWQATVHRVAICYLNSVCVCVCVRACVRACARACACSVVYSCLLRLLHLQADYLPLRPGGINTFTLMREKAH